MKIKYILPFAVTLMLLGVSCGGGSNSGTTPSPPSPPTPTGQATIVSSFAGDTRACTTTSPQGCLDHPDPGMGVGPSYIALFNRQGLMVLNRNGTVFQPLQAPANFWANAGISGIQDANVTNPRATYDIVSHRYYVVDSINAGTSCGDLFAVSAMDDPTHWKAVDLSGHCGDWVMTVGYDAHGVYICEQLSTATPVGSRCFAIPIADVTWTGGGTINLSNMVSVDLPSEGHYIASTNFRTPLAVTDPAVIMARPGLQNSTGTPLTLNARQWTWPSASKPVLSASVTTIATGFTYYMDSFNPPNSSTAQPGSGVYLRNWEVGRDLSPVIDLSGNLWVAVGSDIGSVNGNTGFFWFRIPVSSMTITASGTVYDSTGTSQLTYATPAVDATGNAYFFYGLGSVSEYLSHYVRVVPAGSSAMTAATLLKSGSAVITGGVTSNTVSFGTNMSAQTDPVDTTKVWIYGQYAANPAPYVWTTWVSEVDFH